MEQNSNMPTRIDSSLKMSQSTPSQSTATAQTDQGFIQKRFIQKEPLKFYKTKDMREHEEKSRMAVKTFWENLNNRPKKKHFTSPAGTTPVESILQSTVIEATVQPLAKVSSSGRLTSSLNPAKSTTSQ